MKSASGEISIAWTPFGCGLKILLIGVPDAVSHTAIILSGPVSPVTIHFLLSLTATAVIGWQCPCVGVGNKRAPEERMPGEKYDHVTPFVELP